jgi:hypothetical protein
MFKEGPGTINSSAMESSLMLKRLFFLAAVVLIASSCTKKPEPESSPIYDHVVKTPALPPQRILHKMLTVQTYATADFEVPAHCLSPRLHGNFKSYRYGDQGNRASDEAASIDLLLLDEQQYNDFMHGPGEATTRSVQAAFEQEIDWALGSTFDEPAKYHLVFNNSSRKPKIKFVDADFTLSFD